MSICLVCPSCNSNLDLQLTSNAGQFAVSEVPADAIAALRFSPHENSLRFAVASWDKNVYLYELADGKVCTQLAKFEHRAPVLDVCFGKDDNEIYTACLDWDVRRYAYLNRCNR